MHIIPKFNIIKRLKKNLNSTIKQKGHLSFEYRLTFETLYVVNAILTLPQADSP